MIHFLLSSSILCFILGSSVFFIWSLSPSLSDSNFYSLFLCRTFKCCLCFSASSSKFLEIGSFLIPKNLSSSSLILLSSFLARKALQYFCMTIVRWSSSLGASGERSLVLFLIFPNDRPLTIPCLPL